MSSRAWIVRVPRVTRSSALKSYEEERHTDGDVWSVEALVGYYLLRLEERHQRRAFADELLSVFSWVPRLVRRVGAKQAYLAVRVLFSDRMRWVRSDPAKFADDIDRYNRFILPEIPHVRGGHAEWSGSRGVEGSQRVDLRCG